jgi:acetyltransferase
MVQEYVQAGRTQLTEQEGKYLISLYGIPTNIDRIRIVSTEDDAVKAAQEIGYPVALKLHSDRFKHKLEVGGVKLHLRQEEQIRRAFQEMKNSLAKHGEHKFECTIQPMVRANDEDPSYELTMHSFKDDRFGHIIVFGTGGSLRPIYDDQGLGIPPMTPLQARNVIKSTKIFRALRGYRKKAAVNMKGLEKLLVRFSQMVADLAPFIDSINLNPLLISSKQLKGLDTDVVAVDARVILSERKDGSTVLIRPYPANYVTEYTLKRGDGRQVQLRPVRYEDHVKLLHFFASLSSDQVKRMSDEDSALSRLNSVVDMIEKQKSPHETPPEPLQLTSMNDYWTRKIYNDLIAMCIGDYDREMVLVAETRDPKRIVALARYTVTSRGSADISLLVGHEHQQHGVGVALTKQLIDIARKEGKKKLIAKISSDNPGMIRLCENLGFRLDRHSEGVTCTLYL